MLKKIDNVIYKVCAAVGSLSYVGIIAMMVLNLIDVALLRAKAKAAGIKDIKQRGSDVMFVLADLDFQAVSALCADPDYKARVTFLPNAKEPTLRFRLVSGPDSLKQSKLFVERFASFRKS